MPVMRRWIQLGAVVTVTLTAAACSSSGSTGGSGTQQTGSKHKFNVVYVEGQTGNPFFTSVACGAQAEAKTLGVTFSYQGGQQYSATSQTPVLSGVVAHHPDGIIISPMIGQAMVPPLVQAKGAGVKLVFVDTTAAQKGLAASFISSDNEQGGRFAAYNLAKLVHGKGQVLLEGDIPGVSTTDARNKGFESEIKKYPGIHLVSVQYSQAQPSKASSDVSSVLAAHPQLAGIFAVSTQEVEGAATAIQGAGKGGKVKLVGFDTSPPILNDVQSGVVTGLVVQEPLKMGATAMQQMYDVLTGKPTTQVIHTPYVFLTKQNMNSPGVKKYIYKTAC